MHITLEKDTKKREIVIPAYIETVLRDAGVLEVFQKQPDYLKREQISYIEIAKKEETRLNRINTLTKRLEN